jgi:hypothetical protein
LKNKEILVVNKSGFSTKKKVDPKDIDGISDNILMSDDEVLKLWCELEVPTPDLPDLDWLPIQIAKDHRDTEDEQNDFEFSQKGKLHIPNKIPEPSSVLGIIALGSLGAGSSILRKKK